MAIRRFTGWRFVVSGGRCRSSLCRVVAMGIGRRRWMRRGFGACRHAHAKREDRHNGGHRPEACCGGLGHLSTSIRLEQDLDAAIDPGEGVGRVLRPPIRETAELNDPLLGDAATHQHEIG